MKTITLAFAALAFSAGAPAVAHASPDTVTARVTYGDLNLGKPEGVQSLTARVRRAASNLCTESGRATLGRSVAERKCVKFAVSDAQSQIERAVASGHVPREVVTLSEGSATNR